MPLPSPTYPAWTGTHAVTDDWTHKTLYNRYLAAVYERLLVSGYFGNQPSYPAGGGPFALGSYPTGTGTVMHAGAPNPPTVQLFVPAGPRDPVTHLHAPPAIPATDLQSCYKAYTFDVNYTYYAAPKFNFLNVAEMQQLILGMIGAPEQPTGQGGLFADPTYALDGAAGPGLPDAAMLTPHRAAALCGVNVTEATDKTFALFRRVRPRQIFFPAGNTACDQFFVTGGGGVFPWSRTDSPTPAVVGMRANLYDAGSFTTASFVPCPGNYRGVYQYQGGGTWTPVTDPTLRADTLDSQNPWTDRVGLTEYYGPYYCQPGPMGHGDYYGPWIWDNLRDALNVMVWTVPGATLINGIQVFGNALPYYLPVAWIDPATPKSVLRQTGSGSGANASASRAAAAAAYAGATPAALAAAGSLTGTTGVPTLTAQTASSGTFATLTGDTCVFGCEAIYLGRDVTIETYLLAKEVSIGCFNANGTGLVNNTWKLWHSAGFGAGNDIFGQRVDGRTFGGMTPAWGAADDNTYGFQVKSIAMICKWDRGGLTYTRGTPY